MVQMFLSEILIDTNPALLSTVKEIVSLKAFEGVYIGHKDFSELNHHLFLVVKFDTTAQDIIQNLRVNPSVHSIYPIGSWIENKYMIIITCPEEYKPAFVNFILGKYSEMYTNQQLEKLYKCLKSRVPYRVLVKDPTYRKELEDSLNLAPGTIPINAELADKPKIEEIIYEYISPSEDHVLQVSPT